MNGDYQINEQTWNELSTDRKLWLIFSEFNAQRNECKEHFCRLESEIRTKANQSDHTDLAKKFDRRKRVDTTFAGMMGFVGGLVGFLSTKVLK